MEEVVNYSFTLDELKEIHIVKPEHCNNSRKLNHEFNIKSSDKSPAINHAICEKITTKYAEINNSDLIKNPDAIVPYVFGNGKTVCIKARRNSYNKYKNFSFTNDDMLADYIAIYSYDGGSNEGKYYLTNMKHVRNAEKVTKGNYVLVNEDNIINNSRITVTVKI